MFNTLQNPYFKMKADPARYNWVQSMPMFNVSGYTDQLKTVTASNPQYWSGLESYRQGTYVQFIRGEKPLDEWDDFVAQWYSMGGQVETLHDKAKVLRVEYKAEGIEIEAEVDETIYGRLAQYEVTP